MSDEPDGFVPGVILGVVIMFILAVFTVVFGPFLSDAQSAYARCITDGAPKDRCIEKYLLPEDKP